MYRYYCARRQPALGTVPVDTALILGLEDFHERRYVPAIDCMAWGWVEYNRPLLMKDVAAYGLIMHPREDE